MKLILKFLLVAVSLLFVSNLSGQIQISEVSSNGYVELVNTGGSTIDVSSYWLCNRPSYSQLNNLTVECGQLNLAPGATVTLSGFNLNSAGDELGVYINSTFGSPAGLMDYVIYGNRQGPSRESVAVSAGLWTLGDRAPAIPASQSLNKNTNATGVNAFTIGASSICSNPTPPTGPPASGQIQISEIASTGYVELVNTGTSTLDISNFYLCNRPSYTQLSI